MEELADKPVEDAKKLQDLSKSFKNLNGQLGIDRDQLQKQQRDYAEAVAGKLKTTLDLGASVQSVATASSLGDYFNT